MIRANFKISKESKHEMDKTTTQVKENSAHDLTKEEFEAFMVKSGAAGSFMVFRSDKKDEELGLEEL